MKRNYVALLLLFAVLLPACAAQSRGADELLAAFAAGYGPMPAGQSYQSTAKEWEAGYLSPTLSDALYTEDNGENALSCCQSYAIFLSSAFAGGEIGFFHCPGQEEAVRVAEMCRARLARVRQTRPGAAFLQGACVLRYDKTVVLLMLPDNARAKAVCDAML